MTSSNTPVTGGSGDGSGGVLTAVLMLINGVFAGIGGLYVATQSVAVTLVTGVAVILLAALAIWLYREPVRRRRGTPHGGRS